MGCVSAKELLSWENKQLLKGGNKQSLSLLLEAIGGVERIKINSLRLNQEEHLYLKQNLNILEEIWEKHLTNSEPIQYLCGFTFWRDLGLIVSENVLIPRPESELIIDIIKRLFNDKSQKLFFAELGTGSGALSIALALENPLWEGVATDIDKNAIDIASRNFSKFPNQSNLRFRCGNWWDPLKDFKGEFHLVISNPPYIPKDIYEKLPKEVKNYEPKIALLGGEDGLEHIREIIRYAPRYLKEKGWLLLENHFDQGAKVRQLFLDNQFTSVENIKDLAGIGRFTMGRYK